MSQEFVIYDDGSVSIDATATPEARHYHLATRMAAEVIGTFMLVLGIVGTATMGFMGDSSIVTISLAGGLMLMAAIAVFAHVSGGHFNPIVTLGLAIVGRASWRDVAPYWTSQLAGASLSALVLW
ncbi:MAG: aquaporin, partial [Promicromonosporaceae bacterium]|nr:aquaporin [Promicromonosporaceae bacterium]